MRMRACVCEGGTRVKEKGRRVVLRGAAAVGACAFGSPRRSRNTGARRPRQINREIGRGDWAPREGRTRRAAAASGLVGGGPARTSPGEPRARRPADSCRRRRRHRLSDDAAAAQCCCCVRPSRSARVCSGRVPCDHRVCVRVHSRTHTHTRTYPYIYARARAARQHVYVRTTFFIFFYVYCRYFL